MPLSSALARQVLLKKLAMVSALAQDFHDVINGTQQMISIVDLRFGSIGRLKPIRS
jgi:hypothetical protein